MAKSANFEESLINKLNERLNDIIHEVRDNEIVRFLRARDYDLAKAETMLRNHVQWKKDNDFYAAPSWTIPELVEEGFQFCADGHDKDGRVVLYFPVGRWEGRKLLSAGHNNDVVRQLYKISACCRIKIDAAGNGDQYLAIVDLDELSYWKIAHYGVMQLILRVFREIEENFPETLNRAIIINAPWVLDIVFPMIKPVLRGSTMNKIETYGNSPQTYMPVLLNAMNIEGLPTMIRERYPILVAEWENADKKANME